MSWQKNDEWIRNKSQDLDTEAPTKSRDFHMIEGD